MRVVTWFAVLLPLLVRACLGADPQVPPATRPTTQAVQAPCSFTARAERTTYSVTDQVKVRLVLQNRSAMGTYVSSKLTKPRLQVTRDGQPVPRTLYGQQLDEAIQQGRSYSQYGIVLRDGRTHEWERLLWREYDLSLLGEYHVTAICEVGEGDGARGILVTSTEAVFRIE